MYVLIDIGGTHMRIARASSLRKDGFDMRSIRSVPTEKTYAKAVEVLRREIHAIASSRLRAIGVSVAGTVDRTRGIVRRSQTTPDWEGHSLGADLRTSFRCPVQVENDATCAALGEAVYGKTRGDFLLLVWGTGIGGTQIHRRGNAFLISSFEPGKQRIQCNGDTVSLEDCCAGKGIAARLKKEPARLGAAQWEKLLDPLEQGMINLLTIRPSEQVVFSGGIAFHHPELLKALHERLRHAGDRFPMYPAPRILRRATFGEAAGLVGALALLSLPERRLEYL